MARPLHRKDLELLGEQEVYRLIKQHPEVKACKNLTIDQIRAVFRAYKDIVYTAGKKNLRIALPGMGQFLSLPQNGWPGGYKTYREKVFDKNSGFKRRYFDPRPNYGLLTFDFYKAFRTRFKEETQESISLRDLKIAKKIAQEKEVEKILSGEIDPDMLVDYDDIREMVEKAKAEMDNG